MNLKVYKNHFTDELKNVTDAEEATIFFFMALENRLHIPKIKFLTEELSLDQEQLKKMNDVLFALKRNMPIQYVLGEASFYGETFYVSSATLIPRKETEELVEWILETIDTKAAIDILDIGSGSGCIPITLSTHLSNASISSMDVSEEALKIASENAARMQAEVQWMLQDILQTEKLESYDLVVSNPPYVRNLEKEEILPNVLDYEPHLALFVPDHDPLLFYKKIIQLAEKSLNSNGYLFLEINQYLGKEMIELFENTSFREVILKKDLSGNDRMIRARM